MQKPEWSSLRGQARREGAHVSTAAPPDLAGNLAFGELEPLTRTLLPVFLPLVLPRVTGQKAELLQLRPQFRVKLHQSAGNAQTDRTRLAGDAASGREDQQIELVGGFGSRQSLAHHRSPALGLEVCLKSAAIHLNIALTGP